MSSEFISNLAFTKRWPHQDFPDTFGRAPLEEYKSLRDGAVWVDLSMSGKFRVSGPEAHEYLNSLLTNKIPSAEGSGCFAAFLSPKGKPLVLLEVYCIAPDSFLLVTEQDSASVLAELLDRYLIMRDCEITDETEKYALIHVSGRVTEKVSPFVSVNGPLHSPYSHQAFATNQTRKIEGRQICNPRFGAEGSDFLLDHDDRDLFIELIHERAIEQIGFVALEIARVEAGFPRFGIEVTPDHSWLEAEQFHGLDFHKGCYIGQESIAMAHFRGRPNKLLRGIIFDEQPETDAELEADSGVVGRLGTVAFSPTLNKWIALAYVKSKILDQKGDFEVQVGNAVGKTCQLPFVWDPSVIDPRAPSPLLSATN